MSLGYNVNYPPTNGPVDLHLESSAETSITISNFLERYYAVQNGALDKSEVAFASETFPCAYPDVKTRMLIHLNQTVSDNHFTGCSIE